MAAVLNLEKRGISRGQGSWTGKDRSTSKYIIVKLLTEKDKKDKERILKANHKKHNLDTLLKVAYKCL